MKSPDDERANQLALERTLLANERTLLAYIRTALALAGAGAGVAVLWDAALSMPLGLLLILSGVALLPFGLWRYFSVRHQLKSWHSSRSPRCSPSLEPTDPRGRRRPCG